MSPRKTAPESALSTTVDLAVLAQYKECARQGWPEGHPFRSEVEAISATDRPDVLLERLPTLIRLSRRALE